MHMHAFDLVQTHFTLVMRGPELTEGEKGQTIAYRNVGKSMRWIGDELGRSVSTIKGVVDRVKERDGSLQNAPRSGRPKALTERAHRAFIRSAAGSREKRRIPLLELGNAASPPIHRNTARKYLRDAGYKRHLELKKNVPDRKDQVSEVQK